MVKSYSAHLPGPKDTNTRDNHHPGDSLERASPQLPRNILENLNQPIIYIYIYYIKEKEKGLWLTFYPSLSFCKFIIITVTYIFETGNQELNI